MWVAWRRPTWPHCDHPLVSTTSHMIESSAKVTDVLNSSRQPSKPAFISPLCLHVCFFIDFLPICIHQHAFFAVVFGCFWLAVGENRIHMGFVSGQRQCLSGIRLYACVCVRRYKNPELIIELGQSEDKFPCSFHLHIQTNQSVFCKWDKIPSLEGERASPS